MQLFGSECNDQNHKVLLRLATSVSQRRILKPVLSNLCMNLRWVRAYPQHVDSHKVRGVADTVDESIDRVLSSKGTATGWRNRPAVTFWLWTKGNEKSCSWNKIIPGTRSNWTRPADSVSFYLTQKIGSDMGKGTREKVWRKEDFPLMRQIELETV